jgi:hypothetical protein
VGERTLQADYTLLAGGGPGWRLSFTSPTLTHAALLGGMFDAVVASFAVGGVPGHGGLVSHMFD